MNENQGSNLARKQVGVAHTRRVMIKLRTTICNVLSTRKILRGMKLSWWSVFCALISEDGLLLPCLFNLCPKSSMLCSCRLCSIRMNVHAHGQSWFFAKIQSQTLSTIFKLRSNLILKRSHTKICTFKDLSQYHQITRTSANRSVTRNRDLSSIAPWELEYCVPVSTSQPEGISTDTTGVFASLRIYEAVNTISARVLVWRLYHTRGRINYCNFSMVWICFYWT